MLKKGWLLLIIALVLITIASCGLDYRYSLDESLHNQIECVWGDTSPSHIIYQGEKYTYVGTSNFFNVIVDNYKEHDDIMLSWNGPRYTGYIDEYYSYTSANPMFIYNERLYRVYFHEDYNYWSDVFIIGDTNEEIVFKDIFDSEQPFFEFDNPTKIPLSSKQYPRIKTKIEAVYIDNQWYISLPESEKVWIPSDDFIRFFSENVHH